MTMPPLARDRVLFLGVGLAGSLLVNLSAQFPAANIMDVQGGLFSTPDEASWILTIYTMASFVGIVTSGVLIRALSVGWYLFISSVLFTASALTCAAASDLALIIPIRIVQGFAAGGFGPAAFVAVSMVATGPRQPFGVTILAFVLLFPGTIGPVLSGLIEDGFGWRLLFLAQAVIGTLLALGAWLWVPRQPPDWSALRTDWVAVSLLSLALASLTLVFNQGTRRFWFESDIITWGTAISLAAWAGFIFRARFSPLPIMLPRLLLTQRFGIPIGLNIVLRVSLALSAYLVPQFLATLQGYRPLQIAHLMFWGAGAQLLALPVIWWLMHRLELRVLMAAGLALAAFGTALMANETSLSADDQFRQALVICSVGQLFLLAPAMIVGTSTLKPPDLPTASLAFNVSTLAGTTVGVGVISNFVTEREKFHASVITENVSLYHVLDADRIAALADALGGRTADDAVATARAVSLIASSARRESWALAFGDAFLVLAIILTISIVVIVAIGHALPLPTLGKNTQGGAS